jgi:hypothetical protein
MSPALNIFFIGHVISWSFLFLWIFKKSPDILSPIIVVFMCFFFFYVFSPFLAYGVIGLDYYFPNSYGIKPRAIFWVIIYSLMSFTFWAVGIFIGKKSTILSLPRSRLVIRNRRFYFVISICLIILNTIIGIKYYLNIGGFSTAKEIVALYGRNATVENLGFLINAMRLTLVGYLILICTCKKKYLFITTFIAWLLITVEFGVGLSRSRALFYGIMPWLVYYIRAKEENIISKIYFRDFISFRGLGIVGSIFFVIIFLSFYRGFLGSSINLNFERFFSHLIVVYFNRFENLLISLTYYDKDFLENCTYLSSFGPIRRHLNFGFIIPTGGSFLPASTIFDDLAFNTRLHGRFNADIVTETYYNFKQFGPIFFLLIGIIHGIVARGCNKSVEQRCVFVIITCTLPYAFMAGSAQLFSILVLCFAPLVIIFLRHLLKGALKKNIISY